MTELSTTGGRRDVGFIAGRTKQNSEEKRAGDALKRRIIEIVVGILALFLVVAFIAWLASLRPTVEVTIGQSSSIANEINLQRGDSITSMTEKQQRINYLDSIRVANACGLHAYMAGSDVPLTNEEARAAAKTTAWRRVNSPVYQGDVLSTRGGDHCREAPNTRPFDQR